jgi:diguanylate cyclase (GGDEF)-like protein
VIGDAIYMFVEAHIWEVPVRLLDLPYGLAFLAFGTCVLHPSMRDLCEPVASTERAPTKGRLLLVSISLGLPLLVILSKLPSQTGDRVALISISIVLTALAILRVFRSLRAHARSEERLTEQATHDSLTGLPNRFLVFERLNQALGHLQDSEADIALLFVDVDRFKLVNDSYGHSLGDELLMAVAERLRTETPPHSLIGRVGGDEFVVVIRTHEGLEGARLVAEHLRDRFTEPFEVRDIEVWSSASVGVALADRDEFTTAESLLRDADTAMYQAKEAGRDAVAIFDVEMRDRSLRRARLERDLHTALDNGEFVLHYQPVVSLDPIDVVGFEALLRWPHPSRGYIPPAEFIPLAEETGLITPLGNFVLRRACADATEWPEYVKLAVNLSPMQFRVGNIFVTVNEALRESGLAPERLDLEITESVLLDRTDQVIAHLHALRALGVRISMDDFGTGYSSLSYLRAFPFDKIKIDRSFVRGLQGNPQTLAIVRAILGLADGLDMCVVAEGIETQADLACLAAEGCKEGQGFYFSEARPQGEALKLLREAPRRQVA